MYETKRKQGGLQLMKDEGALCDSHTKLSGTVSLEN